jgi:NAD(P)-dependent dehydrogenase (short-subunit alcohol dehydrogenase family)
VTSDVSVRGAVESAGRLGFHRIDVIVNNAGTLIEPPHPLSDILMERLFYEFDVNVFGAVRVTRAFLPLLEGSPRPCVAQISSIQGSLAQCARPDLYGYRMSKCALNMFNRVLSHELRPQGITCLSVHPGSVKTAMGRGANAISPDDAAIPLYELLNSVTIERTGAFVGPTGEDICW